MVVGMSVRPIFVAFVQRQSDNIWVIIARVLLVLIRGVLIRVQRCNECTRTDTLPLLIMRCEAATARVAVLRAELRPLIASQ